MWGRECPRICIKRAGGYTSTGALGIPESKHGFVAKSRCGRMMLERALRPEEESEGGEQLSQGHIKADLSRGRECGSLKQEEKGRLPKPMDKK